MPEKSILVADDHTLFREGIVRLLQLFPGYRVTDTAVNGNEAEEKIINSAPDIVFLDISMPVKSGIEVLKTIKDRNLKTLPVILTMFTDEEYLEDAMQNGAKGYLLKDSTLDEIGECLEAITNGRYFVSGKLTNHLINRMKSAKDTNPENFISRLTAQELQVLRLLSQNKTSTQIAGELFISYRTVQKHRQNISSKLGLEGYNRLLFFAQENKKLLE